jgi:hypothetical protein
LTITEAVNVILRWKYLPSVNLIVNIVGF